MHFGLSIGAEGRDRKSSTLKDVCCKCSTLEELRAGIRICQHVQDGVSKLGALFDEWRAGRGGELAGEDTKSLKQYDVVASDGRKLYGYRVDLARRMSASMGADTSYEALSQSLRRGGLGLVTQAGLQPELFRLGYSCILQFFCSRHLQTDSSLLRPYLRGQSADQF